MQMDFNVQLVVVIGINWDIVTSDFKYFCGIQQFNKNILAIGSQRHGSSPLNSFTILQKF